MKQKAVIKVCMYNEESRKKALVIVAGSSGVLSAGLKGDDLRQIELTGDGVDVTTLTKRLRKKVGHAELVSVGPLAVDKPKPDPKPAADKPKPDPKPDATAKPPTVAQPQQLWTDHYIVYDEGYRDACCSIM